MIVAAGQTSVQAAAEIVSSVAALIGSLAAAGMLYVNFRKLGQIHETVKRIDTQTKGTK